MSEFLRCRDCKHDKGKCVGSSRRGGHKNCFEPREMTNADRIYKDMGDDIGMIGACELFGVVLPGDFYCAHGDRMDRRNDNA